MVEEEEKIESLDTASAPDRVDGSAGEAPGGETRSSQPEESSAAVDEPAESGSPPIGTDDEETVMSLVEHLTELRDRLLVCLAAVAILTIVCLFFSGWIIDWIKQTAPPELKFYTTRPTEVFTVYVKTGAIAGLFLAMPVIFYQVWQFVRPGLKRSEVDFTGVFVPAFAICFFGGAALARYVAIPLGVAFLVGFAEGIADPLYTVSDYTSFVLQLMLIFGILFEFPIILYAMGAMGLVTSEMLRDKRKIVIFGIFVVAAGATPTTDVGTQVVLAVPLVCLYEITIWALRIRGH